MGRYSLQKPYVTAIVVIGIILLVVAIADFFVKRNKPSMIMGIVFASLSIIYGIVYLMGIFASRKHNC
jgi:hypothetical protein